MQLLEPSLGHLLQHLLQCLLLLVVVQSGVGVGWSCPLALLALDWAFLGSLIVTALIETIQDTVSFQAA